MRRKIFYFLIGFVGVFIVGFFLLFFRILWTASFDNINKADAIVVLGAAEYAGRPSPVFQARLDQAYELYRKGFSNFIITTGGKFPGEKFSEGEVGKKYLMKKGVAETHVIAEESSLTTKQNIARAAEILKAKNMAKIILVSDPFHMYRASIIAKDLGLEPFVAGARSSPISKNLKLKFGYLVRETFLSAAHILLDI